MSPRLLHCRRCPGARGQTRGHSSSQTGKPGKVDKQRGLSKRGLTRSSRRASAPERAHNPKVVGSNPARATMVRAAFAALSSLCRIVPVLYSVRLLRTRFARPATRTPCRSRSNPARATTRGPAFAGLARFWRARWGSADRATVGPMTSLLAATRAAFAQVSCGSPKRELLRVRPLLGVGRRPSADVQHARGPEPPR